MIKFMLDTDICSYIMRLFAFSQFSFIYHFIQFPIIHFRSYLACYHDSQLSGDPQEQILKTRTQLTAKKYECRDRICTHTLAKPAKVAKNTDSEGFPPAKPLLRSANIIDTGAGVL